MRVFQVVVKRQQALGNVSVRLRQGLWAGRLDSQQKIDLRRLIKKTAADREHVRLRTDGRREQRTVSITVDDLQFDFISSQASLLRLSLVRTQ